MIEVVHFLPALDKSGISNMIRSFYGKMNKDKIRFHFVHNGGYESFHDELIKNGSQIYYLEPLSKVGFFKYIENIINILSGFENKPFVHIHTNYLSGIIAFAAKKADIKVRIIHIRGVHIRNKVKYLLYFFRKLIVKYGTDFFAVSQESGLFYYQNKVSFTVIKNGVDLDVFNNNIKSSIFELTKIENKSAKIILFVARLSIEKNHEFSFEILKKLNEKDKNYLLVLAGDGELYEILKNKAKQMGIEDNVVFLGVRDDISDLMNIAYCTILPSLSEGLPNVVIQSQAVGTPCICSSNVTKEVDMGLGLVDFIELEVNQWLTCINSYANRLTIDKDIIKKQIKENGFDLNSAAKSLEDFYLRKELENGEK